MCSLKTSTFTIILLILLVLVSCTTTTPTPVFEEGFAIYLLAGNISPQQLAALSHLELAAKPLLTTKDIVSYTQTSHEIELSQNGYLTIADLPLPVTGISFAVCVNGQPIYTGAFWPGYSSLSFDGIVIDPIMASTEHPFIHIQLGYPGSDFYDAVDPRSDLRILQALDRAGKLK